LGERQALPILRETWLRSAQRGQWLVGLYCIRPDRVSLLACSSRAAWPVAAWTGVWKATAAVRIKAVIGGCGPLWESGGTLEEVVSAADYEVRCAALLAESAGPEEAGAFCPTGQCGMQWQILPAGLPARRAVIAK
jgi:hypothetical protein